MQLEQWHQRGVQRSLRQGSRMGKCYLPRPIQDYRKRQYLRPIAQILAGSQDFRAADHQAIVNSQFRRIFPYFNGSICGNTGDFDAVSRVFLMYFLQCRDFLSTGRASSRPEVQHQYFAMLPRERLCFAVQVGKR